MNFTSQDDFSPALGFSTPQWQDLCPYKRDSAFFSERPASFDFLYEVGTWPGPHIANPFAAYLFTQNLLYAFLLAGAFEIFERMALILLGSYVIFIGDRSENESFDAAIIGDWFIQGGIGVLLGWFFCRVMRCSNPFTPPPLQYPYWFFVYLGQYGLYSLLLIPYGFVVDNGCAGITVGAYLAIVAHPLIIAWFYVWNYNCAVWSATWGRLNLHNCPPRTFSDYRDTYVGWIIVNHTILVSTSLRIPASSVSTYYQSWMATGLIVWFLLVYSVAKGRLYEVFGFFYYFRKKRSQRCKRRRKPSSPLPPARPL